MFGKSFPLFNLMGFDVRLDPTWFILAFLIVWTLAVGFFPAVYPGLGQATYIWMGIGVALGLFFSIVIHEFAHAWVARQYGMAMGGITLFLFGGVAEMEQEAPTPRIECLMALAGPATSVLVMLGFGALASLGGLWQWPLPLIGVCSYLALVNFILILFNMIPAFPLDGGRVLRSLLWSWKDDLTWATRVTAQLGGWFGMFLIIVGVLRLFSAGLIGGIWLILIGWFLRHSAQMSYKQLIIRQELQGEPIQRFLEQAPVTVSPDLSLHTLMDDYFYQYYFKTFPVVEHGDVIGWVRLEDVQALSPGQWSQRTVRDVLSPRSEENSISPQMNALDAMLRMQKSGRHLLMVVDDERLLGLISLDSLLQFLSFKRDIQRPA